MACNWNKYDYYPKLLRKNDESHSALEKLVDDLHTDKERTISSFLCHSGSEDFLWGLVHLLGNSIARVAGNAAYIIGTLAESELGCYRVLALAHSGRTESEQILPNLTNMLAFDDSESVMNAAGTMGTLAESPQGRDWILSTNCLNTMIDHVTALLHTENMWTASNAALVLARLSISEEGCSKILDHLNWLTILTQLVLSLGTDEAGRGMNAAFAVGRLCDTDTGRERLLGLPECDKMISSLATMLRCQDPGASKNACFALSCLATNIEGHGRLLKNPNIDDVLTILCNLLKSEDGETGWFAAMTIRTLASQSKGCVKLRDNQNLISVLKSVVADINTNADLKDEVEITLDILKRLDKPSLPVVEALNGSEVKVSWDEVKTKSGFDIYYQVYEGSHSVYKGTSCSCTVSGLLAATKYVFKLRCSTDNDESPFTDVVFATTGEGAPGPPVNVKVIGCTITQLKVSWDPPILANGMIKGYYVYQGSKQVDFTGDTTCIVTGLTANTQYTVQVCAATSRGKGEKSSVVGTTAEIGAHAPSKPNVTVLGRNEVNVSWASPEVPFGRITRYDVTVNGKVVHSGTELLCSVHRLTPDTEYTFVVIAVTSEGKFDSKPTKKRTAKDEYDVTRAPLYQPPARRDSISDESPTTSKPVKSRKTGADSKPRTNSANKHSGNNVKAGNSVVSVGNDANNRPDSATSSIASKTSIAKTEVANHQPEPNKKAKTKSPNNERRRDSNFYTGQPKIKLDSRRTSVTMATGNKETPSIHRKLTDRYPNLIKSMFPVTVSYVSIQGENNKSNLDYKLKPSGAWTQKPIGRAVVVSNRSTLSFKFERTKPAAVSSLAHLHSFRTKPALFESNTESELFRDTKHSVSNSERPPVNSEKPVHLARTVLPKPTLPSQQYLDGGKQTLLDMSTKSWALPGTTSPVDMATEVSDSHRSRRQHEYIRELTTLPAFRGTADNLFDNSHNAFLQRANTFVNTHRNSLRKSSDRSSMKGSSSSTSGSINLNPENLIPDNQANKLHDKFVPMQLRTQPCHIPQSSETSKSSKSLLEPRGYPGRRLESLARSQSSLNPKSPIRRSGSAKGQSSEEFINMASQEIIKQEKLSHRRPSPTVKTLTSKHLSEPDSVRLSQSWAVNAR